MGSRSLLLELGRGGRPGGGYAQPGDLICKAVRIALALVRMDASVTELEICMHELSKKTLEDVQPDLSRLGATCYVSVKPIPKGSWRTVRSAVGTFEGALLIAEGYVSQDAEVAVFLEHAYYGGIMVWSTVAPGVANRFDGLSLDV